MFMMQHGPVGSMSASKARGARLETRSGHILSFFLLLIQEGRLSVVHLVLLNCLGGLSLPRNSVVRLTDPPGMFTMDLEQQHNNKLCS